MSRAQIQLRTILFILLLLLSTAEVPSWGQSNSRTPNRKTTRSRKRASHKPPKDDNVVLVGAGDIAGCRDLLGAEATAKLIEQIPGTVFAAGDLAYERGTAAEFTNCYEPTWGRFKERTKPALGNHEYGEQGAAPYFKYWGDQAGPVGKGYYSYELGVWHIVVLNTNCDAPNLGGCAVGSAQETWLKQDLAEHANDCILAYGHHALFSSGIFRRHAIHPELKPLWMDLYAAHADLVLAGHEHSYERFAPQDPNGNADPEHGIREIVAGTGGRSLDLLGFATPNSEVRNWDSFGVLKLTLAPGKYTWEFIPAKGWTFQDSGTGVCHNRAVALP
ncbi:MAG TPA: metallophosphoesterase [Candidatus Dormibacteraeota bacterium]|nr:metallophosphoesterase [Candidatus Dormibacteraeota bacterium]